MPAISQWRYAPTLLNGVLTPVDMMGSINLAEREAQDAVVTGLNGR